MQEANYKSENKKRVHNETTNLSELYSSSDRV